MITLSIGALHPESLHAIHLNLILKTVSYEICAYRLS